MEKLQQLYEELKNKQSWIRNGLKEFMEEWKRLTEECPIKIKFLIYCKKDKYCEKESMNYCIQTASAKIYKINDACLEFSDYRESENVSIEEEDIRTIKEIIVAIQNAYKILLEELEKEKIEYDKMIEIIKKIGG